MARGLSQMAWRPWSKSVVITLAPACPRCLHSRLTHRRGVCQAIIQTTPYAKGQCGCEHIPAIPGSVEPRQLSLRAEQARDESVMLATNSAILGSRQ